MYPWLKVLYKKIINSKIMLCKNCNLLIGYPCNLGVNLLVFKLVKWILCLKKKKCLNCINCNLLKFNNHPNFIIIDNKNLNISFIKEIVLFLNKSLYFSVFKIIYFINFNFTNSFVFNYLLKLMEEPNYKLILVFSYLNSINIPLTFLSRCQRYNLYAPKELFIYKWINNNLNNTNYSKLNILTSIRLNHNSPLDSIFFLKNKWLLRMNILNMIKNIFNISVTSLINILNNSFIKFNLYLLYTIFLDILNYKYTDKIYNIDSQNVLKNIKKKICIKNINLILKKIIFCINDLNNNLNLNINILVYNISYNIYYLINKKK